MNAFDRIRSLKLTKQISLSIVLGGLFALSPLYADFGGSALASIAAFLLGLLAMAAAAAEAAGSPRVRNHGWLLGSIAAVVLAIPWVLALTGVGQVLGTFSIASVALATAATWRITTMSKDSVAAAPGTKSAPVAIEGKADEERSVADQGKGGTPQEHAKVRSADRQTKAKRTQAATEEGDEEKGARFAKADAIVGHGKETQQADADHGPADHQPSTKVEDIKSDVSTQKKPARQKVDEPMDAA